MSVWVLVIYMGIIHQGGPTVIDNISTKSECERVRSVIVKDARVVNASTFCVEVRKAIK